MVAKVKESDAGGVPEPAKVVLVRKQHVKNLAKKWRKANKPKVKSAKK